MAARGIAAQYSYAGRTRAPKPQPIPTRIGGFGGAAGLCAYLHAQSITHLVDATHPFAAQISANAIAAARDAGVPLLAFERPPWQPGPGDDWQSVPDLAAAVAALPDAPRSVFLAIGRQSLAPFLARPAHRYLLRLVDPPEHLPLPGATVEIARGPFTVDQDRALMQRHGVELIVAKNAGGDGARAKLDAARALGLPVVMVARPAIPPRHVVHTVAQVLDWLDHDGSQALLRGV